MKKLLIFLFLILALFICSIDARRDKYGFRRRGGRFNELRRFDERRRYRKRYGNGYGKRYGNGYRKRYGIRYEDRYRKNYEDRYDDRYGYGKRYENRYIKKYGKRYGKRRYGKKEKLITKCKLVQVDTKKIAKKLRAIQKRRENKKIKLKPKRSKIIKVRHYKLKKKKKAKMGIIRLTVDNEAHLYVDDKKIEIENHGDWTKAGIAKVPLKKGSIVKIHGINHGTFDPNNPGATLAEITYFSGKEEKTIYTGEGWICDGKPAKVFSNNGADNIWRQVNGGKAIEGISTNAKWIWNQDEKKQSAICWIKLP